MRKNYGQQTVVQKFDLDVERGEFVSFLGPSVVSTWVGILVYNALVFVLALTVFAFFLFPLGRKALKPVTELEKRIRQRDPKDKSKLADSSDDRVLKPLLAAIDEVHDRSEAAMRRALTLAYADPVTRLPNRLRFLSKVEGLIDRQGQGAYLAVCDLDGFRKINASIGPRLADAVLATVAERLRDVASGIEGAGVFHRPGRRRPVRNSRARRRQGGDHRFHRQCRTRRPGADDDRRALASSHRSLRRGERAG